MDTLSWPQGSNLYFDQIKWVGMGGIHPHLLWSTVGGLSDVEEGWELIHEVWVKLIDKIAFHT